MSVSAYQYHSDANNLYQVQLPDDFSVALGLSPAVGTEPYVPVELFPRYANWRSTAGALRSSIYDAVLFPGGLPKALTVSGVVYSLLSEYGEQIAPYIPSNFLSPQGPQGPTGATGATGATGSQGPQGPAGTSPFTTVSGTINTTQIQNLHNTPIVAVAAQGAGTIIVPIQAIFKYKYGGSAFSGGGNVILELGTTQIAQIFNVSVLIGANSTESVQTPGGQFTSSGVENAALQITNQSASFTGGNGSVDYEILYSVWTPP